MERKMARRFAKVSEEEIMLAINETACFYPSDLVNTKATIPSGSVKGGGYIYLDTSRLAIYPPLFTSPSGDKCLLYSILLNEGKKHPIKRLTFQLSNAV